MSESSESTLRDNVGEDALAYVLATDTDTVSARVHDGSAGRLDQMQEVVLAMLVTVNNELLVRPSGRGIASDWAEYLANLPDPNSPLSTGNTLRIMSGGEVEEPVSTLTPLERTLVTMATRYYPGLLVSEPADPRFRSHGLPAPVSNLHPYSQEFQRMARADSDIGRLFTHDDYSSGPHGRIGHGGQWTGVQLWTLAETLISSGWTRARLADWTPTSVAFAEAVVMNLRTMKQSISGGPTVVPARVGLTGVLLPDGVDEMELGWGSVRRAEPRDDVWARSTSLSGQLRATNERGEDVVINLSGDLILEVDVPFAVIVGEQKQSDPWPSSLLKTDLTIEEAVENLRLALLLAFPERRIVLHQTWRAVGDPFISGQYSASWRDPAAAGGLMPTQLIDSEVNSWSTWASRIETRRIPAIGVAIRRLLAAAAERRTSDDILVDAVIVWENLFGAKTETTLRVSSALAWLLGTSGEDRRAKQTHYKKIYAFRSQVVHGTSNINQQMLFEYAVEAVQISIDAMRAIFDSKANLLMLVSSEERSLEIMLRGEQRQTQLDVI